MRLIFDRGTIVLVHPEPGLPDPSLRDLPGVMWDSRVARLRAPACFHADIVRELQLRELRFIDEVKVGQSPLAGSFQPLELRPYQEAALLAWELARQRGVLALPTGSGKTRVALAAMANLHGPVLCLVPTRALLRQWLREIRSVYNGPVGCLGDGERTLADVCVATFESAYRLMPTIGRRFALIIVDEAHHFGAGIRDEALEMSTAAARLGLTATPPNEAGGRLEMLIGPTIYQLGVADLAGKWLAAFDRVVLRLPLDAEEKRQYSAEMRTFRDVYQVFRRAHPSGDFQKFTALAGASEAGRAALKAFWQSRRLVGLTQAKRRVVRELLARHPQNRLLIFTADNDAAYAIAREHLVMPMTCDISRKEREDALEAFKHGELRALVSARVLNEGIDIPDADVAIVVAGAHGQREYVQRLGRLLRPRDGKRAIIYELVTAGTSEVQQAARRSKSLAL